MAVAKKIRVGIFFGGASREREISFAGGRTVYDNLSKDLFEPVPFFVDSAGNFCLIQWQYIYKGTIRDFYPNPEEIEQSKFDFQIYAESIKSKSQQAKYTRQLGKLIKADELDKYIDFAFLCLHGSDGEDGRLQGLFEYHRIPYSGSGILSSAIGMNKAVQKKLMHHAGFNVPAYYLIPRSEWQRTDTKTAFLKNAITTCSLPIVVKAANQGSSIGISVCESEDAQKFTDAVEKAFFIRTIEATVWQDLDHNARITYVRLLADIRDGIGMPIRCGKKVIYHPDELFDFIEHSLQSKQRIQLEALNFESDVIIESFIKGKEFSCIVIEDENAKSVALPPTEIRKGKEVFDYRSKYLPGLSRKITPIELPLEQIERISAECERLFTELHFSVYARIDGFITDSGEIFLNDPNTTSGMLPSSFFFHQASEIGLTPSQFITYIIATSLSSRYGDIKDGDTSLQLHKQLMDAIVAGKSKSENKLRVAVMLGGYSSERHISVESGRNIFEKLASSTKYLPFPVFVSGNRQKHHLHIIPINVMLKDNADDILEKVNNYIHHPVIDNTIIRLQNITQTFSSNENLTAPYEISYADLKNKADAVFIALHGRPGEDGQVQAELNKINLPFNGSDVHSSQTTINKFETNEILLHAGLHAAKHKMFYKKDYAENAVTFINNLVEEFPLPLIAKPVDDGCSSAVKLISRKEQLSAYLTMLFRNREEDWDEEAARILKLKPKEEFPVKEAVLIESLIVAGNCDHFLEITGGMLMHIDANGKKQFTIFEASEALSEGEVLSLEEKFLAGQGQNITPARYAKDKEVNARISMKVKEEFRKAAELLMVEGYCRIDAFVRIKYPDIVEVLFIEVNSLPGMTPATCIFHQAAIENYKPYEFIDKILEVGEKRMALSHN